MAVTVASNNTQTATVSTEHTLYAPTTAGVYVLTVSLTNMLAGDIVELRIYNKTLTGDTITTGSITTLMYLATYNGVQASPVVASVPVAVGYAVTFTLKQTAGTSRNFPWNVITL